MNGGTSPALHERPCIGIDIGGSKTHALLSAGDTLLAEAFAGSANISSIGQARAQHSIADLSRALQLQFPDHELAPEQIVVGAAGADTEQDRALLEVLVRTQWPNAAVHAVHDAGIVLAAAGLSSGIVVISGTGTTAMAVTPNGATFRAGGLGHLLGDEGGGYGIVRSALRHALRRQDTGASTDQLTQRLLNACGAETAFDLMSQFYRDPDRKRWAQHSGLVFHLAAEGVHAAKQLVDEAAEVLAGLVCTVSQRSGVNCPVVLAGGIVQNQPQLSWAITGLLRSRGHEDIRILERTPAYGALALARAASTRSQGPPGGAQVPAPLPEMPRTP